MLTYGDVDVAAEPRQKPHQALDRHITELPVEQSRNVRLTETHTFDASSYTDIATSLAELYRDAFSEKLSVRFSFVPNEKAIWRILKSIE